MILALSLAFAASPAELAAQLPGARAQLDTCAHDGCTDEEGARAAWLAAVGTYIEAGIADGSLAATVGLLDPALFERLPDVLQAAASDPLPWAVVDVEVPLRGVVRGLPIGASLGMGSDALVAIHETITPQLDAIQRCAAPDMAHDPGLAGRMTARLLVDDEGAVVHATLAYTSLERPALQSCVLERLSELTFPAAAGGRSLIDYRLLFAADEDLLDAAGRLPAKLPYALLRNRPTLEIQVVDPDGAPVDGAFVRFDDELEEHSVNAETGRLFAEVRYLPDGSERLFTQGELVMFDVVAPGFAAQRVAFVPGKGKRHHHTVVLPHRPIEVTDDATPEARAAMEAWQRWQDAMQAAGNSYRGRLTLREQDLAFRSARAWFQAGGGEDALELCLRSAPRSRCLR